MSDLISESTGTFVPLAVLAASLAGSAHCVAMCGPLILVMKPTRAQNLGYHLGRLLSYASLGFVSGRIGQSLLLPSSSPVIAWVAASALGLTFIGLGISLWKGRSPHLPLARLSEKLMPAVLGSRELPDLIRHASAGALSAFLPCGWLHSMVLATAATGSGARGAFFLFLFWAGTLPALVIAPWGMKKFFRPLLPPILGSGRRAPALLLIAAGLISIGWKMAPLLHAHPGASPEEAASCHASSPK